MAPEILEATSPQYPYKSLQYFVLIFVSLTMCVPGMMRDLMFGLWAASS